MKSLYSCGCAHPYDDLVVLDVTASEQLADQYLDFASHGFHVISANKLAGRAAVIIIAKFMTLLKNRPPLAV